MPAEVVPLPPPAPPRVPSPVERLHQVFVELRHYAIEDLGIRPVPPDDAPNWARSAATVGAWIKFHPEDSQRDGENFAQLLIGEYVKDPYWAGAKHRDTGAPQPYPWNALMSEKVWRPLAERLSRELSAPEPMTGGVH